MNNDSQHNDSFLSPSSSFFTKENWSSYVENNRQEDSFEDLGYIEATESMIDKLETVMLISDQTKFRSAVEDLVANRKDLLSHAFSLIDDSIPETDYEKSIKMTL